MNEEIEELSAYFKFEVEDRNNVLSVIALYETNKDMNRDLLMMIYKILFERTQIISTSWLTYDANECDEYMYIFLFFLNIIK
jgi:hypothetical protein